MIVKRTPIAFYVPLIWILPMIFILPFLIITIFTTTYFAIIPTLICIMLILFGAYNLNSLIRFGNKLIIIDSYGVTFCIRRVRHIEWSDISDIRLQSVGTSDFLAIEAKNSENFSIPLNFAEIKYSVEDIYSYALETWVNSADISLESQKEQ